jgi:hypothetical protein
MSFVRSRFATRCQTIVSAPIGGEMETTDPFTFPSNGTTFMHGDVARIGGLRMCMHAGGKEPPP